MTGPANSGDVIKCPHCGQDYAVRADQWAQYSGRTINCTRCGQPFTVGGQSPALQPPPMPQGQNFAQPPGYPPGAAPYVPTGPSPMQPQMGGYPGQPYYGQPAATSGFAIWSLVCGIFFCIPISSILAIIFGIIGLNKTRDPRVKGKGLAIAGICLGGFGFLLILPMMIALLLPALNRAREQANRVKCASNMRMIGQEIEMYANANAGRFPHKLEDLLQFDPKINHAIFVCPSDAKTPPTNTSLQAAQQEIASGKNCSYIYVGSDLTASASPDDVVLFEPLSDHSGYGMNVLFGDFHVEFLDKAEAQKILDQQAAGTRPIKYSAGP